MAQKMVIRFENEHREQEREVECDEFVQLTFEHLRLGPNGEFFAYNAADTQLWYTFDDNKWWTDVVIYAKED